MAAWCMVAWLVGALTPAWAEARHALVVGNEAYSDVERLKNPVADAKQVAAGLTAVGFEVTLLTDADRRSLDAAVDAFVEVLDGAGEDAVGLFYFAGHGVQMGGMNWLIPIDAEISQAASLKYEALSAQQVLDLMADARNRTDIVVLDACRNNPYRGRFSTTGTRAVTRGLAEMSAPEGAFIVYSTSPGAVAYDGTGSLSPFARAFTEELPAAGVSIGDMMVSVRRKVRDETAAMGAPQVPWTASSLLGQFRFVPAGDGRGLEPIGGELPMPTPAPIEPVMPVALGALPRCGPEVRKRRRLGRVLGAVGAAVGTGLFVVGVTGGRDVDFDDGADEALWLGGGALGLTGLGFVVGPSVVKPSTCEL